MAKYNALNVKLSNLQLNYLKSGIENRTLVTLKHSSHFFGDFNDQTNFPHKFLLTDAQVLKVCKAFADSLPANIKLSKTQLSKMTQLRGFASLLMSMLNQDKILDELRETIIKNKDIFAYAVKRTLFLLQKLF